MRAHAASAAVRSPSSPANGLLPSVTVWMLLAPPAPKGPPPPNLVAVHAGRERRLLELLLHGFRRQRLDPVRPHESARVDEARELVAGEQRLLERRVTRQLEVLRVREHRTRSPPRDSPPHGGSRAVLRMLVERGVDLVVEVVQQRSRRPRTPRPRRTFPRVCAHGGLNGERVAQERLALRVTSERLPGPLPSDFHIAQYHSPLVSTTLVADALMESFVIEGGRPSAAAFRAAGNKNGALPILAATLLASEPVTLSNVPRIRDVETMARAARGPRGRRRLDGAERASASTPGRQQVELDPELCSRIRASFLLAGPLLARFGRAASRRPAAT